MKTLESMPKHAETLSAIPMRRHDRKRMSSWRVLTATVAGFPAFLWQLTRGHQN